MFLIDMKNSTKGLPKNAGGVKLQFGYRGKRKDFPFRAGKRIVISDTSSELIEFFLLKRGKQFLLFYEGNNWFGGDDEYGNAFLVKLYAGVLDTCFDCNSRDLNEEAFYQALKPKLVVDIEEKFNITLILRGIIWIIPILHILSEFSIETFKNIASLFSRENPTIDLVRNQLVLKTSYRFTGKHLSGHGLNNHGDQFVVVGNGSLKFSQTSRLMLRGAHILIAINHLYD